MYSGVQIMPEIFLVPRRRSGNERPIAHPSVGSLTRMYDALDVVHRKRLYAGRIEACSAPIHDPERSRAILGSGIILGSRMILGSGMILGFRAILGSRAIQSDPRI